MSDTIRPSEISEVLLSQLKEIDTDPRFEEIGTVLQVSDGVVRIHGLKRAEAGDGDARKHIDVLPVQSADGIDRDRHGIADLPERLRGSQNGLDLGGRGIDRAHAQIIRALLPGLPGPWNCLCGGSHDFVIAHQLPRQGHRHILRAHMDTLRIDRQGHIHTVIDDQRYLVTLCDGVHLFGDPDIRPGRPVLLPKLKLEPIMSRA